MHCDSKSDFLVVTSFKLDSKLMTPIPTPARNHGVNTGTEAAVIIADHESAIRSM